MDTKLITSPRRLSDSELIERVKDLAGRERRVTASLVAHLAELDERRLHVAEGCCSLFAYCTEVLHFSEGAAYNRIKAARAARKFPLVLDKLAGGSVHLATVRLLAPFLTEENYRDLLDEATHKTRRQVEKIIARLRPLPPIATSVRKVSTRVAANNGGAANDLDNAPAIDFSRAADDPVRHAQPVSSSIIIAKPAEEAAGQAGLNVRTGNSPIPAREPQRAKVAPLSPDVYRIQFAVDADTYTALGQARELLRHQIPDGDAARVIGLALKVLVKKLTAQKLGAGKIRRQTDTHRTNLRDAAHEPKRVQEHRASSRRPPSRHISAEVRRQVWNRDAGQCAFVANNGHRCSARGGLEFHHVEPFARGGPASVENIQLRCRSHNQYEAEVCFGKRPIDPAARNCCRELVPGRVDFVMRGGPSNQAPGESRNIVGGSCRTDHP